MSNYFIASVVLLVVLGVAKMWPEQAAPLTEQEQAATVSVTGCLQAGDGEGVVVLTTDDKQSYLVQANDELAVSSHVNHRVELTGTVEKTDSHLVLKVAALMMIASSCEQP